MRRNKSRLIFLQIARKVGDPNIPRPWSRYSLKKEEKVVDDGNKVAGAGSKRLKGAKDERKNNKKVDENDDPELQEFLQVMRPRSKSKLWANDTLGAPIADQNGEVRKKETKAKKEDKEKSGPEHVELNTSNGHVTEKSDSIARNEVISDMDYFKSRVKTEWSDSETESSENDNDDGDDDDDNNDQDKENDSPKEGLESKELQKVHRNGQHIALGKGLALAEVKEDGHSKDSDGKILDTENPSSTIEDEKDEVLETSRLFVRNLPYSATYTYWLLLL